MADASFAFDTSQVLSQSGGDDLATLKNIFQDASAPAEAYWEPAPTLLAPIIKDLGMKRVRFLQSDNTCDLDSTGTLGTVGFVTDSNGKAIFDPYYYNQNDPLTSNWKFFQFAIPEDNFTNIKGVCNLVSWTLPWALNYGLSPHFALASFLPDSFQQYGAAETWTNDIVDRYKSYVEQLVRYILTTSFNAGAQSVVFEVSNELDGEDYLPLNWDPYKQAVIDPNYPATLLPPLRPWGRWLWWIDPNSYTLTAPLGDPSSYPYQMDFRRVDDGIAPMEKVLGDVLAKVKPDYPNNTIEIAGPAFTSAAFGYFGAGNTPEERFLDEMLNPTALGGRFNVPWLNYFSFHYYGDFKYGYGHGAPDPTKSTLSYVANTACSKIATIEGLTTQNAANPNVTNPCNGLGVKLFASEWGPMSSDNDINFSHAGAAWAAAFLTEAVADGVSMGSYLILSDAFGGQQTGDLYGASLTHKATDRDGTVHYYPKPAANVFKMFAMMTGQRNPPTVYPVSGASNLGAFVTSDANSASVLVFNYDGQMFQRPDPSNPAPSTAATQDTVENYSVELDSLWSDGGNVPFNGTVTVQSYLVDANTSNLYAFVNGNEVDPSLQMQPSTTATVVNGTLTLTGQLGLGVTYLRVSQ